MGDGADDTLAFRKMHFIARFRRIDFNHMHKIFSNFRTSFRVVVVNVIVLALLLVGTEIAAGMFISNYSKYKSGGGKGGYTSSYKKDDVHRDLERYSTQPGGAWKYFPATGYLTKKFSSEYVNVDEEGVRRTLFAEKSNCVEIWIFGSSAVFGDTNSDETTVASQLQRLLNERKFATHCYAVRNFGVHGFMSFQDVRRLQFELTRRPPPKFVFFLHGANDFLKAFHRNKQQLFGMPEIEGFDTYIIESQTFSLVLDDIAEKNIVIWRHVLDSFDDTLYLARRIGLKAKYRLMVSDPNRMKEDYLSRRDHHQHWHREFIRVNYKVMRSNLALIKGLSEAYGFKAVVSQQPVVFDLVFNSIDSMVALSDSELNKLGTIPQERFSPEGYIDVGYAKETYQEWGRQYMKDAQALGIGSVSIADEMTKSVEVNFANGVHYTHQGSKKVADLFIKAVRLQ